MYQIIKKFVLFGVKNEVVREKFLREKIERKKKKGKKITCALRAETFFGMNTVHANRGETVEQAQEMAWA